MTVLVVVALLAAGFAIAVSGRSGAASTGPAPRAVGPLHTMNIGVVSLTVATTNPMLATLVDEFYLWSSVYSFLLNYGPDWELEYDLAIKYQRTVANPTTYEFWLLHNAYFIDPRTCTKDAVGHFIDCDRSHPVTGADVKFSFDFIKQFQDQTAYMKPLVEHVASVTVDPADPYHVTIVFDGSYAPAISSFAGIPILPRYIWLTRAIDDANPLPIGSGPYMVRPDATGTQMVTPPPLVLDRNPIFYGEESIGRQVFPDTIQYVSYTTSGAMAVDLTLGRLDLINSPSTQEYMGFLAGKPGIIRQSVPDGFEAEQAINVLPDDLRAYFASITSRPLERGHTNQVLANNPIVRQAMYTATNRQKMITNALNGLASPGDTLMPAFAPWHLEIPPYDGADDKNGDGNPFDLGLEEYPEDPAVGRQWLVDAGWLYVCATSALQTGTEFPLCRRDGAGRMVDPLEFRYSTFNTEPFWESAARGVIEDAGKAGIKLNMELLNAAQMSSLWYQLDYDIWLWDWVWTPITDASLFLIVQTCQGIVTLDNDNGFCYRDAAGRWVFDEMYNQTLSETDPAVRRALSDDMQRIIYSQGAYNLPFYLDQLYAMNEVRFTNWGDWRAMRAVPPDIGNPTIIGMVPYPVDQKPPQFTLPLFEGATGRALQFSVAAIDPEGAPLTYRWDFDASSEPGGAGVNADGILDNDDQAGSNTATPTFTYASAGDYGVSLRVSETGGDFFTVKRTTARINPPADLPPRISAVAVGPSDPTTYAGDLANFAASANDPFGRALTFTWNFGDGSPPQTTSLPTVSHQYSAASTYTARLTARNTAGQSTESSILVPVVDNVAPAVAPLESKAVVVNTDETFVAFASDANSRDVLTYAWTFGDGASATGNPVTHRYTQQNQQYTLGVTVSDGHGHSVSQTATINVVADRNTAPRIDSLVANPALTYVRVPVTITGTAHDDQGNILRWDWDFTNDGTVDKSYTTPLTAPGSPVVRSEVYTYPVAGTQRARLTITDVPASGTPRSTTTTVTISVRANDAPTLTDISASPAAVIAGQDITLSSTSNDVNGDRLTYTWQWGDGSETTGLTAFFGGLITGTHAYDADGDYLVVLIVNDGKGGEAREPVLVIVTTASLFRVTTNIDLHPTWGVPGKILIDGTARDEWGLGWVKVEPGAHTVSFTDIANLKTPAQVSVTSAAGETVTINGQYQAKGWLRVMTDPPVPGTIYVNGNAMNDWGIWLALEPGSYTVSFGAVPGFAAPAPQTVAVAAESLTTVVGSYTFDGVSPGPDPATFGLLRVTTRLSDGQPGVMTQIEVDGIPRDEWGLAWVKMPVGQHTLTFSDVWNFGTPAPQTFTIAAGVTTTLEGVFEVHGWLRVMTDPPAPGTIFVNGIPRNDWGMWQSMSPGSYKVSFGPVPGMVPPAVQTVSVVASTLTTVVGTYTSPAAAASASSDSFLTPSSSSTSPAKAASSGPSIASASGTPVDAQGAYEAAEPAAVTVDMSVRRHRGS